MRLKRSTQSAEASGFPSAQHTKPLKKVDLTNPVFDFADDQASSPAPDTARRPTLLKPRDIFLVIDEKLLEQDSSSLGSTLSSPEVLRMHWESMMSTKDVEALQA